MGRLNRGGWVVGWGLWLALASATFGQAFPEAGNDRVYLQTSVRDRSPWEKLEQAILRIERSSPRRYYVVLLDSSGDGPDATRDFTDRLFARWSREGGAFDADRSVLIVLALRNRQVSVRAGATLQSENGLRGAAIDRELVQPLFTPLARRGDYAAAVEALIRGIEQWISQGRSGSPGMPDRSEALRGAAEASVAAAQRVIDDAAAELEKQRSAGLGVKRQDERLVAARNALAGMQRRVESSPREVMADGQALQADVQAIVSELRSLAVTSEDARLKAEAIGGLIDDTRGRIDRLRQQGLATASLEARLAEWQARADKLETLRRDDPQAAMEEAIAISGGLVGVGEEAAALPAMRASRRAAAQEATVRTDAVAAALEEARSAGVNVNDLLQKFGADRERLAAASADSVSDERGAQNEIAGVQASLAEILQQTATRRDRHRLLTRTLPLAVGGTLAGLGSLAVASLWLRRRRKHREVSRTLADYRRRTTQIMERLDQLRERHRRLEVADPDFKEPLQGPTLQLYVQTQTRLHGLWTTWLGLMEKAEKAQHHVEGSRGLGVKELQTAETILKDQQPLDAVLEEASQVEANLARLELVHEDAEAVEARIIEREAAFQQAMQKLAAMGVSSDAYARARGEIEGQLHEARRLLAPDPLTSRELFEHAEQRMTTLAARVSEAASLVERSRSLLERLGAVRSELEIKRAGGLRLDERGGNPDEPIEAARVANEQAIAAIVAADAERATRQLEECSLQLDEAADRMRRVESARSELPQLLEARRREQAELESMLEASQSDRDTLEREHAADAWRDVGSAFERARQTIGEGPVVLERVRGMMSDASQQFLAARRDIEGLTERHAAARAAFDALREQRARLEQLRADCLAIVPSVREAMTSLGGYLQENAAIVASPAVAAFGEAEQLVAKIESHVRQPAPNWPVVHQKIARAREGLAIAKERAERDVAACREVLSTREAIHARANEIGGLLRRENKDRPPTNLRYRNAADTLGQIDQLSRRPGADWPDLLRRLQLADLELKKAEEMARQDLRLANQAIGDLESAGQVVRNARGFNVLGFAADVSLAEQQLTQAQQALSRQDYEQAIRLASGAEQSARAAVQTAERQAELRQQQIEEERRRRAAEVLARRTGRFPIPGGLPQAEWRIGRGGLRLPGGIVVLPGSLGGFGRGGGGRSADRDSGPSASQSGWDIGGGASQSTWDVGGGGDSGASSSNW